MMKFLHEFIFDARNAEDVATLTAQEMVNKTYFFFFKNTKNKKFVDCKIPSTRWMIEFNLRKV